LIKNFIAKYIFEQGNLKINAVRKVKDRELIEGLLRRDRKILMLFYQEFFPVIEKHVLLNSGNKDDAKDLFQEVLVALYRNFGQKNARLTTDLKSYIFVIGQKMWYKELRFRKRYHARLEDFQKLDPWKESEMDKYLEQKRFSLYQKHIVKLPEDCRKLFKFISEKITIEDLKKKMDFSSGEYTKRRKYMCIQKLIKLIKEDPDFNYFHDR